MHAFKALCIVLAASLGASCMSLGTLDADVQPPDRDHVIFVLGVQSGTSEVGVFRGDLGSHGFSQNPFAVATYFGRPNDGFVVGESHAGNTLGVTDISVASAVQQDFSLCHNSSTVTFRAPAGKVVYVGNVSFGRQGFATIPTITRDLEAARRFLRNHYPNLADALVDEEVQLVPLLKNCTVTIYIYH